MFDQIIGIDFETYYATGYSLGKGGLTTEEYIMDPRFELIGAGVRHPDGTLSWMEEEEFRRWLPTVDWSRTACLAHHAHFDGRILAYHFGISPCFWIDTLSWSRPFLSVEVGGSLSVLMKHFGVGEKGKEVVNAKGKRRADFTTEEWMRYGEYCKNDIRGTYDVMECLEAMHPFPVTELKLIDITVRMFTEPSFVLDETKMAEYLVYEKGRKQKLMSELGTFVDTKGRAIDTKKLLSSNDKFAGLLAAYNVEPPKKWSVKKKRMDWAFSKSDAGFQQLQDHEDETIRDLVAARLGVKSTINESRTERMLKLGAGGRRMPVYLSYSAAHTSRWGGGDKTNFQNLEKTNKLNPMKGVIKKSLRAPDGEVLVSADSAQIEARFTGWLAGQEDQVEAFRVGRDLYSEFATIAYRRPIDRKTRKEDEIPGFVGKTCMLGLQYGMGAVKLAIQLAAGANGGPPVVFTKHDADQIGVDVEDVKENDWLMDQIAEMPSRLLIEQRIIHVAVCNHLVKTYRTQNSKIPELWRDMGEVIDMMYEGEEAELADGILMIKKNQVVMPNGMPLHYPDLSRHVTTDEETGKQRVEYTYKQKKGRAWLHGSKLVENVVQRLCRDIVAEQMVKFYDLGARIVTMTHDEIVGIVVESQGQVALDALLKIMKTPPSWASTLPLKAEGGFGKVYGEINK